MIHRTSRWRRATIGSVVAVIAAGVATWSPVAGVAAGTPAEAAEAEVNCGTTERVSVPSDDDPPLPYYPATAGRWGSTMPSLSGDGRFVAFRSDVMPAPGGSPTPQVYVRDRQEGTTELVSVNDQGVPAAYPLDTDLWIGQPKISRDGRYVAFISNAKNLVLPVPGESLVGQSGGADFRVKNQVHHVYVHDRVTRTTERVSVASDGTPGNDNSTQPAISGDGRFVVFVTRSSNLVPGDTNNVLDVFVRDRDIGTTERVSVASDRSQGVGAPLNLGTNMPSITPDGQFVVFMSEFSNLVPGDTNGSWDVFLHNRDTGVTERVSVSAGGGQADGISTVDVVGGSVSDDARFVLFNSSDRNLAEGEGATTEEPYYVRDRVAGTTELGGLTADSGVPADAALSGNGRYIAYVSVPERSVALWSVLDRNTGITRPVAVAADCTLPERSSLPILNGFATAISADGRVVGFTHKATNLDENDTDRWSDVYVHTIPELEPAGSTDLGTVLLGQSRSRAVTIANTSAQDVTVEELEEPAAPFTLQGGSCGQAPFTLSPGESCGLQVLFRPQAAGEFTGRIMMTTDAPLRPAGPDFVPLSGTGTATPLWIGPQRLDFGEAVVDAATDPLRVTVGNGLTRPVTVSSIAAPSSAFRAAGGTCGQAPFTIAPNASCTLKYVFTPGAVGDTEASVAVSTDAGGGPYAITLAGTGLPRLQATLTEPTDGASISRAAIPTLPLRGAAEFTKPAATDVTFVAIAPCLAPEGNGGLETEQEPSDNGGTCPITRNPDPRPWTPYNEVSPDKYRYTYHTKPGDGTPLVLDATRRLTGVIQTSSVDSSVWDVRTADGDLVGVGAGRPTVDITVSGHRVGDPASEVSVLGTASVTYTATPEESVWQAPWSVELPDGLDKADFDALTMEVVVRGPNVLHGAPTSASRMTVPTYAASFDRTVEVALDDGPFTAAQATLKPDGTGTWEASVPTPPAGTHTVKVRAVQGWTADSGGSTVQRISPTATITITITE